MDQQHTWILEANNLESLSQLFRVLGDSSRVKILFQIFTTEMCVSDVAKTLCMTESAVSHHLRILKMSGLVKRRREGKTIFYALNDDHVRAIISQGCEHILEKSREKVSSPMGRS